jgi:hypothetical protein
VASRTVKKVRSMYIGIKHHRIVGTTITATITAPAMTNRRSSTTTHRHHQVKHQRVGGVVGGPTLGFSCGVASPTVRLWPVSMISLIGVVSLDDLSLCSMACSVLSLKVPTADSKSTTIAAFRSEVVVLLLWMSLDLDGRFGNQLAESSSSSSPLTTTTTTVPLKSIRFGDDGSLGFGLLGAGTQSSSESSEGLSEPPKSFSFGGNQESSFPREEDRPSSSSSCTAGLDDGCGGVCARTFRCEGGAQEGGWRCCCGCCGCRV